VFVESGADIALFDTVLKEELIESLVLFDFHQHWEVLRVDLASGNCTLELSNRLHFLLLHLVHVLEGVFFGKILGGLTLRTLFFLHFNLNLLELGAGLGVLAVELARGGEGVLLDFSFGHHNTGEVDEDLTLGGAEGLNVGLVLSELLCLQELSSLGGVLLVTVFAQTRSVFGDDALEFEENIEIDCALQVDRDGLDLSHCLLHFSRDVFGQRSSLSKFLLAFLGEQGLAARQVEDVLVAFKLEVLDGVDQVVQLGAILDVDCVHDFGLFDEGDGLCDFSAGRSHSSHPGMHVALGLDLLHPDFLNLLAALLVLADSLLILANLVLGSLKYTS